MALPWWDFWSGTRKAVLGLSAFCFSPQVSSHMLEKFSGALSLNLSEMGLDCLQAQQTLRLLSWAPQWLLLWAVMMISVLWGRDEFHSDLGRNYLLWCWGHLPWGQGKQLVLWVQALEFTVWWHPCLPSPHVSRFSGMDLWFFAEKVLLGSLFLKVI